MVVTTEKREAIAAFAQQVEVVEGRSLWKDARRRFLRNKAALTSLIILTIIGLAVIVGPHLSQYTFDDPDWGEVMDLGRASALGIPASRVKIVSYGKDGQSGGSGEDADIGS